LINPEYVAAAEAGFMRPDEQVLGAYLHGEARAYPTRILSWHEVVNDTFGSHPVLVSWCPLAFAGIVHSHNVEGRELTFGVSGLLYKSNLLMYDKQTESLWSQVKNVAVTGPMAGTKLEVLPSSLTNWKKWLKKHPRTMVLSLNTGYDRDYSEDPYADYYESRRGFLGFFRGLRQGHGGKDLVAGVVVDGRAKAYPLDKLRRLEKVTDTFGGKTLTSDSETGGLEIVAEEGNPIAYITVYWFVWKGIHPDAELFVPFD
jgi:hypothetical protein